MWPPCARCGGSAGLSRSPTGLGGAGDGPHVGPERLRRYPAMRWVVGGRAVREAAASASQMGRFETEWLTRPENLAALTDLPAGFTHEIAMVDQPTSMNAL